MSLFRFPHSWAALAGRSAGLEPVVAELDDRDRALEDHLAENAGESGETLVSYATGGAPITYAGTYKTAPVPTYNIEAPTITHPAGCYIADATTTGFKAHIVDGTGTELAAGGAIRIFWHARPAGA